jgi:hypothetical protein
MQAKEQQSRLGGRRPSLAPPAPECGHWSRRRLPHGPRPSRAEVHQPAEVGTRREVGAASCAAYHIRYQQVREAGQKYLVRGGEIWP